jgi:hypothetical protein
MNSSLISARGVVKSFGQTPALRGAVDASNPAYTGRLAALPLQAVLVKANDPATLERVRTFLAGHAPPQISTGPGVAATPPRTFGEAVPNAMKPRIQCV